MTSSEADTHTESSTEPPIDSTIAEQISQWRAHLEKSPAISSDDADELEDHLLESIQALQGAGLAADEAVFIAIKRLGAMNEVSAEYAREHSGRLWKQLIPAGNEARDPRWRLEILVMVVLAALAGVLAQALRLFDDMQTSSNMGTWLLANIGFVFTPSVSAYLLFKRGHSVRSVLGIAGLYAAAFIMANAYIPTMLEHLGDNAWTEITYPQTFNLMVSHVPVLLWLAGVGGAYVSWRWRSVTEWMNFIRFTGEAVVYYVLIATGGLFLTLISIGLIDSATDGSSDEWFFAWVVPTGAAAAVTVVAWLVSAKQGVIENMAPILAKIFSLPLALVLFAFSAATLLAGNGLQVNRDLLWLFDVLLVVVVGIVLYNMSSREPDAKIGFFDIVQVVLLAAVLIANALVLFTLVSRISEYGTSPNKIAALGQNIILIMNLWMTFVLYLRFALGRATFAALERLQVAFIPVYILWLGVVAFVFPLAFWFK